MLTRPQRLQRSSDIQRTYQVGRKAYHPFFRIVVAPGLTSTTRVAMVVSLKVSKKATERNRLKRQLRALWRQLEGVIATPFDCVIVVQAKALGRTTEQLHQALLPLLKKVKLI